MKMCMVLVHVCNSISWVVEEGGYEAKNQPQLLLELNETLSKIRLVLPNLSVDTHKPWAYVEFSGSSACYGDFSVFLLKFLQSLASEYSFISGGKTSVPYLFSLKNNSAHIESSLCFFFKFLNHLHQSQNNI